MLLYAKHLSDGDLAIGLFNLSDAKGSARFNLDEVGLPHSTGRTLKMTELWTGEEVTVVNSTFCKDLEAFDCAVYRAKVVERK